MVIGSYVSVISGETFVEIAITGNLGKFFDLDTHAITGDCNISSNLAANGKYKWDEYIFWKDEINNNYGRTDGYPVIVSDTLTRCK